MESLPFSAAGFAPGFDEGAGLGAAAGVGRFDGGPSTRPLRISERRSSRVASTLRGLSSTTRW